MSVPGHLDGFPVVTGRRGETLIVSADAEWAERLTDAAARVLRDALSQRLGPGRVLIEGDGRIPDADLTIEFVALDPLDGHLVLDARWSFVAAAGERSNHSGRTTRRCSACFRAGIRGGGVHGAGAGRARRNSRARGGNAISSRQAIAIAPRRKRI